MYNLFDLMCYEAVLDCNIISVLGNHMISSAIWNKLVQVNFFKDGQNCTSLLGECNL